MASEIEVVVNEERFVNLLGDVTKITLYSR